LVLAIVINLAGNVGHSQQDVFDPRDDPRIKRMIAEKRAELANRIQEQRKNVLSEIREKSQRYRAAQDSATQWVDGRQNPDLVPYDMRMQAFFGMYNDERIRQIFSSRLSSADLAVLDTFKARYQDTIQETVARRRKEREELEARAASMSAIEIAAAQKASTARERMIDATRHHGVMRQLSPEGQKIVNQWAYDNIRPRFPIVDEEAIALAEPELYKERFLGQLRPRAVLDNYP